MTGLEHGLVKILEAKCADVGSKFSLVGPSKVLAQPSQRYLFAKLSRDVPQVIGEAKSLEAMADASESDKDSTNSLIPRVYASGKTEDGSKAYLVTDYLDMRGRLGAKSQRQLGEQLAKMHKNGTSPDGRFGFEVPTFCGATEQDNTWTRSWTEFWSKRRIGEIVGRIYHESRDDELLKLEEQLRQKVYPLLLQSVDFKIVPAILHGDLWSGNVGEEVKTSSPVIFESSYYGHNEADLGIMHMFGGFTREFFDGYHSIIPRLEPYYDERIKLYELYHHLNHALMFGGGSYRGGAVRIMKSLIAFAEREAQDSQDKAGL